MFRSLRHRNFRLFFTGQLISLVGTWMQAIAQSWLVYRLTGSATLLGLVVFASQVPVLLLAPIGGTIADRSSRQRMLVMTQTSSMILAAILAVLTLSKTITVWEIMVLAALLGITNAFDIPARQAFVVEMVGREDLMNAIALNSSVVNGARIVGPAVAGILVAAIGEGWCFAGNAVSYVAVIAGLLMMRLPRFERPKTSTPTVQHLTEGFRFAMGTGPVRALLLLLGAVSILGMPYAVLMPIFAQDILHAGSRGLGILMGATGIGALLASLVLAFRSRISGLGRWVAFAAAGFGLSLIAFSYSRSLGISVVVLLPLGFAMMTEMASSNTLIQSMVPDALRGRVMAVYSMMFMGMAPIGSLLAGALAGRIGAPATVRLGGIVCIGAAALFAWRLPGHRLAARELILANQMVAGYPAEDATGAAAPADEHVQTSD